ncbi:hypothetical protein C8F01DRAFT_1378510 [Mycena amicta]|nr:hypothetical protein C8F01DRAFT_1378510 [Mycena amicta]
MDEFTVAATPATQSRPLPAPSRPLPALHSAIPNSTLTPTAFVHRFLLTQSFTIFANLFELPQGTLPTEGTSDANPIVLARDSASDFEGLLKYLYASPLIAPQNIHISELQPILGVFRLAHKYEMTSWNLWASNAL